MDGESLKSFLNLKDGIYIIHAQISIIEFVTLTKLNCVT